MKLPVSIVCRVMLLLPGLVAVVLLGGVASMGIPGCAAPAAGLSASSRSAMEFVASRRGVEEIELEIRILDAVGDCISEMPVVVRIGETATVSLGGGVDGDGPRPQAEVEINCRFATAGRGGLVEIEVAAVLTRRDGRVDRPVGRFTVGFGSRARVVVG
ncbi:MAG: hypothetical protein ACO3P9_01970 [Phycisphaerales bacterium]|jgi:hypothetical protein